MIIISFILQIVRLIINEYFRKWIWILVRYGFQKRYIKTKIRFLNKRYIVTDSASFIWQLKEIFVDELYKFPTKKVKPIIIDCGSNVGTSCVYFAMNYPKAKIIAFEADPRIFSVLLENMKGNGIINVSAINKAVWVDNKGIKFGIDGADAGSIFYAKNTITIPTVRLKNYLNYEIDMLKMDIEGAESKVIIDCGASLKNVKNLFIEYHSFKERSQDLDEILKVLSINGFKYYIESAHKKTSPLYKWDNREWMDLRLNIFAKRI